MQTGAPLAVQTLTNISDITYNGTGLRPGTVRVFWEKPILTDQMKQEDIMPLKEKVENMMRERIQNAG